jgi:hypothetical protein
MTEKRVPGITITILLITEKMLKGEAPKTRPLEGLSGHIQGEDRSIIDNVNVYGE